MNRLDEIKKRLDEIFSIIETELLEQKKEVKYLRENIESLEKKMISISYKAEAFSRYAQNKPEVNDKDEEAQTPNQEERTPNIETESIANNKNEVKNEGLSLFDNPQPAKDKPSDTISFDDEDIFFEVIDTKEEAVLMNDVFSLAKKQDKSQPLWVVDIPGSKIEYVEDGISLNDKFLFTRELFDEDEDVFNSTMDRINEKENLDEVIKYLRSAYPLWDENSDTVYRLYMIIRRRFRDNG